MKIFSMISIVIIIASLIVTGCSSTATISTQTGQTEAKIIRSDKDNLYVQTFDGIQPLPRSNITYIDHPGNGVGNTGLVLSAIAIGYTAYSYSNNKKIIPLDLLIYIPMMIWGYSTWNESVSATEYKPLYQNSEQSYLQQENIDKSDKYIYRFSISSSF